MPTTADRLTTTEAAAALGVRERTVIDYVARGLRVRGRTVKLARRRDLGRYYFTPADVDAFRRRVNELAAKAGV